ncbi:hypothetical protein CEXT_351881 [Caerostris extrusa]|uniref:Uncharacterized protein n=1 Tax=Caerostris extrusa TaxID=172846 RepID=A0AAV4TFY6_CAEEX|nr:hypothetical protein CEXT_351881 [Caerostris extrusa]
MRKSNSAFRKVYGNDERDPTSSAPMKYLLISFAITAVVLQLASAQLSKRCQSVCSRSDGQEFCQKMPNASPMRFGKRDVNSTRFEEMKPATRTHQLYLQRCRRR